MKTTMKYVLTAALALLAAGCDDYDGEIDALYPLTTDFADGLLENEGTPPEEKSGDKFEEVADNPFVATFEEPVSTFSVDADGASYAIMRRYSEKGYEVNKWSVRIEEFLNYFTFDYPAPTDGHSIAINAEVGPCPWNSDHQLLRLGLKGKELAESEVPQANFVFLVDVSGSMSTNDKLDLLKKGLRELLHQLRPSDRISIITYSGEVKKLLESTPVSEISKIDHAIGQLTASGSTAGGQALKMAYEEALACYDPEANNRVIMGTDGDFNVGVTSTDALVEMVQDYAKRGIYMTCLGFGMGNLNDAMMEKISNAGNGTYHYIDCENEMMKVFVHERSQFVSVANDVKCQVTFDSTLVSQYRLIGYENRVMANEDFENDEKDAAEVGAGQTITALYEIVPTPKVEKVLDVNRTLATLDVRYKKSLSSASIPLQVSVNTAMLWGSPSANLTFAAGVAAYGMLLRQSPYKGGATLDMAAKLVEQSLTFDPHGYRAELLRLINMAANKKQ